MQIIISNINSDCIAIVILTQLFLLLLYTFLDHDSICCSETRNLRFFSLSFLKPFLVLNTSSIVLSIRNFPWLWRWWPPHRLSKRQSQTTVNLRTPITQMIFLNQGMLLMLLLRSNHFLLAIYSFLLYPLLSLSVRNVTSFHQFFFGVKRAQVNVF